MLLQFDGTFILMAISFIIFMFVMQKIFFAPMAEVRKERDNYIADTRNKARQAKEQAALAKAEYDGKISEAKVAANSTVLKSTSVANAEKAALVDQKSQEINQKLLLAKESILKDKNDAQEALKQQVASLAQNISIKILGEEIPISGITPEIINKYMNG